MGRDTSSKVFKAIQHDKPDRIKDKLKHANPTALDSQFYGFVHLAASLDRVACLKELNRLGSDLNFKTPQRQSALHIAAKHGSMKVVEFLLSLQKVEISTLDIEGNTPLATAVLYDKQDVFDFMLRHFLIDVSVQNQDKNTVLHYAIKLGGRYRYVAKLLTFGASPNVQNCHGETTLHIAVNCENVECISVLLKHNADATICNDQGQTPADLAQCSNQERIRKLFSADSSACLPIARPTLDKVGRKRSTSLTSVLPEHPVLSQQPRPQRRPQTISKGAALDRSLPGVLFSSIIQPGANRNPAPAPRSNGAKNLSKTNPPHFSASQYNTHVMRKITERVPIPRLPTPTDLSINLPPVPLLVGRSSVSPGRSSQSVSPRNNNAPPPQVVGPPPLSPGRSPNSISPRGSGNNVPPPLVVGPPRVVGPPPPPESSSKEPRTTGRSPRR